LCDHRYAILYFDLDKDQQSLIPMLLRQLLNLPDFKTKSARMGKVAFVGKTQVKYYQLREEKMRIFSLLH